MRYGVVDRIWSLQGADGNRQFSSATLARTSYTWSTPKAYQGHESATMNSQSPNEDLRILVVDDTLRNIQILDAVLEKEGYRINVATSGPQALEIVKRARPHLVLLDVMMPEMDGFEVCRRLKADAAYRDIPVIFLTARTETEDLVEGFEVGAVDYVTKPFNSTELLVRVKTHLSLYLLQTALVNSLDENARIKREHEAFLRHELNNRITTIMGYSHLLKVQMTEEKPQKWADHIHQSAEDMSDLINTLRALQDIEAGTTEVTRQEMDLVELIKKVAADLGVAFGGRAEIELALPDPPVKILGDANLLFGVYHNLAKNAVEHIVEHEVVDSTIGIALSVQEQEASVAIHNGGPPIPAELIASFFEKFNTHGKQGGTGLGTSYAHLVTTAHGGEIDVQSSERDGTTVTVRLPSG